MLNDLLATASDLIFETRCGVCCVAIERGLAICSDCNPSINLLSHSKFLEGEYCLRCGDIISGDSETICQYCLLFPLPIRHLRSIWSYVDSAEILICAYKYKNSRALAPFLATTFISEIRKGVFPPEARFSWDAIIPLPSTADSLKLRMFSPVGEISKLIAKELNLPLLPLSLKVAGRHPAQASLSPKDRLKHLKRKFIADKHSVRGKRILLVDDVVTSGASIAGSAIALKAASGSEIDCISLCRSDLFRSMRKEIYSKF